MIRRYSGSNRAGMTYMGIWPMARYRVTSGSTSAGSTASRMAMLRLAEMKPTVSAPSPSNLGRAAANGQRVMDRLFDHPIVSVAVVRDWLGLTPAGANQIVNRLEGIGLLREITGYARNRRFRFEPYLRLFEERGEETA